MPALDVDVITHAIEDFVAYALREEQLIPEAALSDVVTYFMGHTHADSLFIDGIFSEPDLTVSTLRTVCDSDDPETRKNTAEALKRLCYKYASQKPEDKCPANLVALFHAETLKSSPHRMDYPVRLDQLVAESFDTKSVILFCINAFNPRIKFVGNFAYNNEKLNLVHDVLKATPHPTAITFQTKDHTLFGPGNRSVFLSSVGKSSRLVLDGAALDRWSPDDFKHLLFKIQKNPHLRALSLTHTQLDKCCRDPSKFPYILELLSLKQLKVLTLHANDLRKLPEAELAKLQEAINNSPIDEIGLLHFKREKKATASSGGIFANPGQSSSSTSVPTVPATTTEPAVEKAAAEPVPAAAEATSTTPAPATPAVAEEERVTIGMTV